MSEFNFEEKRKELVNLLNHKGKVYLASPWFNDEQMERCEWVRDTLKSLGFEVFSPKDEALAAPDDTMTIRQQIFDGNIKAIKECSFMVCITNTKDLGSIMEAGVAYAFNVPIVYFAEGLNGPFNLMLAQSGKLVCSSRESLKSDLSELIILMHLLCNKQVSDFDGKIE